MRRATGIQQICRQFLGKVRHCGKQSFAVGIPHSSNFGMDERRSRQRLRALKDGSITFNAGAAIDCIVRNVSAAGGRAATDANLD